MSSPALPSPAPIGGGDNSSRDEDSCLPRVVVDGIDYGVVALEATGPHHRHHATSTQQPYQHDWDDTSHLSSTSLDDDSSGGSLPLHERQYNDDDASASALMSKQSPRNDPPGSPGHCKWSGTAHSTAASTVGDGDLDEHGSIGGGETPPSASWWRQKVAPAASSSRGGGDPETANSSYSARSVSLGEMMKLCCDITVDATIVMSTRGKILMVNEHALELFGYKRWELVDKNVRVLMEPKYARVHDLFLRRYERTRVRHIVGESRDGLFGLRKDGSLFRMLLKVHEYRDSDTRGGAFFVGVVRDVSQASQASEFRALLAKLVPDTVSERLVAGQHAFGHQFRATVGVVNVRDLTRRATLLPPTHAINLMSEVFALFDAALRSFSCVRIQCAMGSYVFATKLTKELTAHAANGALCAQRCVETLAMRGDQLLKKLSLSDAEPLVARAGVATGVVLSGVVPGDRVVYGVWGVPVDVAGKLAALAAPNEALACISTQREAAYCVEFADEQQVGADATCERAFRVRGYAAAYVGGGQPASKRTSFAPTLEGEVGVE